MKELPTLPMLQRHGARTRRAMACVAAVASTLLAVSLTSGCAVEVRNLQAREQLAREAAPAGSVALGWRVYQQHCARCHGPDGTGTAQAPDLLQSVRTMGPRRFVGIVFDRYDVFPSGPLTGEAREAWIGEILQRRQGSFDMPAWESEPQIRVHVNDLYAWLTARSEGRQGPGRPPS